MCVCVVTPHTLNLAPNGTVIGGDGGDGGGEGGRGEWKRRVEGEGGGGGRGT